MQKKFVSIFIILLMGLNISIFSVQGLVGNWSESYTVQSVNGHAGYTTEWRGSNSLDKPVIIILGYDPGDTDTALGAVADYSVLIADMNSRGYDIMIFDYLDGDADIRQNAENLADFVRYLDSRMNLEGFKDVDGDSHPDYELAIVGASMGGIVARTMFVQEYDDMGVDIFITLDSPHHGVYISNSFSWAEIFFGDMAARQMIHGSTEYNALYGWLQSVESTYDFKVSINNPMHTAAIALSNGEARWKVSWGDLILHTKYHPVSSYYDTPFGITDFIPYHSAMNLDDTTVSVSYRWGYNYYNYRSTTTSYFDTKIQNSRAEHGAPEYSVLQSMNFLESNWGI